MNKHILLATGAVVAATMAAAAPAMAQNALDRLVAYIESNGAPPEAFSYDVVVDKSDGFTLRDVVILQSPEIPDSDRMSADLVEVRAIDIDGVEAGGPPMFLDATVTGLVLPRDVTQNDPQLATMIGGGDVPFDISVSYVLDPDAQTFTLDSFSLDMPGGFAIDASLEMSGVGSDAIANPEAGMMTAMLHGFSLEFADTSLVQSVLAIAAQGMPVDQFMDAVLVPQMDSMSPMFAEDPASAANFEALGEFLADYADPQGTLVITANPPQPIPAMGAMMAGQDPATATAMLGLTIEYQR